MGDTERILSRLVRVGTVMNVDEEKLMVRVKFQNEDLPSGWLFVLQHIGGGMTMEPDGGHTHTEQAAGSHTHAIDINTNGPEEHTHTEQAAGSHTHVIDPVPHHTHGKSKTAAWIPKIDDTVLCLFLPYDEGDGFVLGAT